MSEQRAVDAGDLLKVPETKSERKARIAAVLDRGFINMTLDTGFLPEGMYGEWCRFDNTEIARMKSMGFEIFKGQHPNALHSAADGTVRVGDTILMVTPQDNKDLIDEVLRERIDRIHGMHARQVEESNFVRSVDGGITPIVESRIEEATMTDIEAAQKGK